MGGAVRRPTMIIKSSDSLSGIFLYAYTRIYSLDVHCTFMLARVAAVTLAHIIVMNVFGERTCVVRFPRLSTLTF